MATPRTVRAGVLAGLTAYGLWGLFPFYFHALAPAGAVELLAQRVVWTLVVCLLLLTVLRRWGLVAAVLRRPRQVRLLALAAAAIALNWGVYGLAVTRHHVLEASLGYFVNPLVTVLLGVVVLHERLRRLQWAALGLGVVAVVAVSLDLGRLPWTSLVIAVSFGVYGLVKKQVAGAAGEGVDPLTGLAVETGVLALPALAALCWLASTGAATFATEGPLHAGLLALSGVTTLVPLLLFAAAAARVPLSTVGLLQYVTPVLQFVAALLLGESLPPSRWAGFALVWVALALLSADALRHRGRRGVPAART